MTTILSAIEEANTAAGIRTMSFANLKEFQSFMDSFNFVEYPVNVVVPFTVNGNTDMTTGIRKSTLLLRGWVLTRCNEDPNDYRSKKMEETYVNPMRTLAKKFIKNFLASDIIDPQQDSVRDSIVPEYKFLNAHTFGVSYSLDPSIKDNVC